MLKLNRDGCKPIPDFSGQAAGNFQPDWNHDLAKTINKL